MRALFSYRVLLLLVLIAIEVTGLFSEHIQINRALGWDGKNYAELTVWFEDIARAKHIDSYQFQRILTPAVIYYGCKWLHIPLSIETVPFIYGVYNLLLIVASALLFFAICKKLSIRKNIEIIGFSGLFFNYFILKNTPYYPVLTDISAFFMGILLCYFFIARKQIGMLLVLLIGHFTYPLFLLSSLPLFVNIRTNAITARLKPALLFKCLAIAGILLYLIILTLMLTAPQLMLIEKYTMSINKGLLPISVVLILWYLWRLLNAFSQAAFKSGPLTPKSYLMRIAGIIIFAGASYYVISRISIPETVFTPVVFLMNIFQQSIDNPMVSLVSHIVYFGPAIILLLLFYKQFATALVQLGDSAIIYFLFAAFLSLGSESRQFIHFYPFIIIVLMQSLNKVTINNTQAFLFGLISIIFSKCWLTINAPGIFEHYNFANFPDQRYFMNHGPFMSDKSYLINLVIVVITTIMMAILFKRNQMNTIQSVFKSR